MPSTERPEGILAYEDIFNQEPQENWVGRTDYEGPAGEALVDDPFAQRALDYLYGQQAPEDAHAAPALEGHSRAPANPPLPGVAAHEDLRQGAENAYILQRNAVASTRLNMQQYIWKRTLGYNLHPSISLDSSPRICDLACGTGLWLLEVAADIPGAQCDGFDIDISQAPAASCLPSSVTINLWDMMSENVPEGIKGVYDVVHLRLVTLALGDDATPLIRNLYKLLKPGGYLQWDEGSYGQRLLMNNGPPKLSYSYQAGDEDTRVLKTDSAIVDMLDEMQGRAEQDWFVYMSERLTEHGFTWLNQSSTSAETTMLKFETDLMLLLWEEIVFTARDEVKQRYRDMLDKVKVEVDHGCGFACGKFITVAKKLEPFDVESPPELTESHGTARSSD